MQPKQRALLALALIAFVGVLVLAAGYFYIKSGGLVARQKPSMLEGFVAQTLVDVGIPTEISRTKNPLQASAANAEAGRELYKKNCEVCHGVDGKGKTAAGLGVYPPPLDLSSLAISKRKRSDGDLFYFIRNGVRNTAMPAWTFTDQQTWQLVTYIHKLPITASAEAVTSSSRNSPLSSHAHYVGSATCQTCHSNIYESWKRTLMANVVRDPKEHPEAIIPDLSKTNALLKFATNDIALVYGSKWKQRYFKKVGADFYPFSAQWDVAHKIWRPYFVKDDWWAPLYPADNMKRPTGTTCDGCHSVNYDISTKTVTEWNVGCEKCHGPGSEHIKAPSATNIVNPARLDFVAANDTCIQCHSQGRPVLNPIDGNYYDWPVGFHMGKNLSAFWKLEDHKLGETTFTHFADGTAHKNRMQGNDFVSSVMYTHGVTCFTCHDSHGTTNNALLRKPATSLCLDCHGPDSPNGPRGETLEMHTHHKAGSTGSECIACHMPKIQQTIADVNVRSHTFRFVAPEMSESLKVPNACNACHTDKSTAWATAVLKGWQEKSPWRVAN